MLRVTAIAVLITALVPGVARGAPWRWPVRGRIAGSFTLSPGDPYAAGRRRGILIASAPGSVVRSVCAGRVAFAGAVGRAGPTLSVACGALRATFQGLASIGVRRGAIVLPSTPVAVLGASGRLHLGARVEDRAAPHRYVDPARLLGSDPPRLPPLGRAPPSARRRLPPARPAPPPAGLRAPPAEAREPAGLPPLAWLGLALLAAALPAGALWRRRPSLRTHPPRRASVARG
jgi:murein DD-endopeptidase MepM/ murein hydrolase activator NlpD